MSIFRSDDDRLAKRTLKAARSRRKRNLAPGMEVVESRVLMTTQLTGGVLNITGGAAAESVSIRLRPGDTRTLEVFDNSPAAQAFATNQVARITVSLGGGDDRFTVDFRNGTPIPVQGANFDGGVSNAANTITVIGTTALTGDYNFGPTGGTDTISVGSSRIDFNNVKTVSVGPFKQINVTTPRSQDTLLLTGTAAGEAKLIGTSGQSPIRDLAFFQVGEVVLDLSTNDAPGAADDTLSVDPASPFPVGGSSFTIRTGVGNDSINLERAGGSHLIDTGEGNDSAIGGSGDDTIATGLGNDVVVGGGGNDLLSGGDGNDTMFGDTGNDSLFGGSGNDEMLGGSGNDLMTGDNGDDSVAGGDGNDVLFGGAEFDSIVGGLGNDFIFGGTGDDVLLGGVGDLEALPDGANDGADQIVGGFGSDVIDGGNGRNILDGSDDLASDSLIGAGGDDIGYDHKGFKPLLDELDLGGGRNSRRQAGGLVDVAAPNAPANVRGAKVTGLNLVPFLRTGTTDNGTRVVPDNGPRVGAPPLPFGALNGRKRAANATNRKAKKN